MKRKRATDIDEITRQIVYARDGGCIFCGMNYRMSDEAGYGRQVMHYINRSQGGLGIPKNLAVGCVYHHQMYDNGLYHKEMKSLFADYLIEQYLKWDAKELVYSKWEGFPIK